MLKLSLRLCLFFLAFNEILYSCEMFDSSLDFCSYNTFKNALGT